MAGYDGYSMSNNARAAYADGLVPASKTGIPIKLLEEFCDADEWHHSSKFFNCINFYRKEKVRAIFGIEETEEYTFEEYRNETAVAALAAHKAEKELGKKYLNCEVCWLEWGGTRRHPKAYEMREKGATIEVRGQTATITLADGQTFQKRLATKGFFFTGVAA